MTSIFPAIGLRWYSSALWRRSSCMAGVAYRILRTMAAKSQFQLLRERRFAPLFWTQFLGAANDNLFKFAFTLLATYHAADWGGVDPSSAGFIIAAIFIAPYVLFSATSGQLADKIDKARLIRFVKNFEIVVMLIAAA